MIKALSYILCTSLSCSFIPTFVPETRAVYALSDTVAIDTLAKDTLVIDEVVIDKRVDALEKFETKKAYHKEIYLLGDNKNMVTLPHTGGLAINIQKLFNHFSKRGKGARRLQRTFEREYEEDLARAIWDPLLEEYTTLRGDSLAKFNLYCKPSFKFLSEASHYERVAYLLRNFKNYSDSTEAIHRRFSLEP